MSIYGFTPGTTADEAKKLRAAYRKQNGAPSKNGVASVDMTTATVTVGTTSKTANNGTKVINDFNALIAVINTGVFSEDMIIGMCGPELIKAAIKYTVNAIMADEAPAANETPAAE